MDQSTLLDIYTTRYLNKKEIMYRLPSEVKIAYFWPEILTYRKNKGQQVPLLDQKGNRFWFCSIPYEEELAFIDEYAKSSVNDHIAKLIKRIDNKYITELIVDALIDEAFNSSVIEGAFSTKKRSKELIQKKIVPTSVSEQMILNNYHALEYILENLHKPIDEAILVNVYNIITKDTLSDEEKCLKYRNDSVIVWDYSTQKQIYEAPPFNEVPKLMDDLFYFINTEDGIHPIVKASIIHFYMVYIHPFFDGNGRTARVISYMYLLQHGYDFFKFFSISTVIKEHKNKYYKAILDTEDYSSDLTYFIDFNVNMILRSLENVLRRIGKEYGKIILIREFENQGIMLTKRLKKTITSYIRNEKTSYTTIEEYQKKHKISYETARQDLSKLSEFGIFSKTKKGNKYYYKFIGLEKLGLADFSISK